MIVLKICIVVCFVLTCFFGYVLYQRGRALRIYKELMSLEHLPAYKDAADSARKLLERFGGIKGIRIEIQTAKIRAICFFLVTVCLVTLFVYLIRS